ncbi:MAG TPA: preprotein translocase subunit SecG [Candidatus Paceibacterota bacterium]|jgi:protein translocase SecG subunit|nr:preprotein translocase subunit SecG [Candidatus Paceibacterota bacterium]
MAGILHTIQVASAVVLIALVLLQRSSGDMGSAFGEASFFQTRRGAERFFFILTVAVAVIFAASSIATIVLAK